MAEALSISLQFIEATELHLTTRLPQTSDGLRGGDQLESWLRPQRKIPQTVPAVVAAAGRAMAMVEDGLACQ